MTSYQLMTRHQPGLPDGDVVRMAGYVPVIDLSGARTGDPRARRQVAAALGSACERSGFFAVVGHGMPAETITDVYRAIRALFALPAVGKSALASAPDDPLMRGYGRPGSLAASNAEASVAHERELPDLSETWTYNRLGEPGATGLPPAADPRLAGPNIWPDLLPGFARAVRTYYAAMEELAGDLMRLFALALRLPETWFDDKIDRHMTNLTANYYPPQPSPPAPGQLRKGQHSDWGSLTILYQDDAPGGLQVLDKHNRWLDVPALEGSFVINVGNLMAAWTNDFWVSTVHRVVNPPREYSMTERYSVPFFHQPNFDAVIETIPTCVTRDHPIRYAPITSGAYILEKFRRAYGG
jgi:isopenicillin N synthase-like dioxygenase